MKLKREGLESTTIASQSFKTFWFFLFRDEKEEKNLNSKNLEKMRGYMEEKTG